MSNETVVLKVYFIKSRINSLTSSNWQTKFKQIYRFHIKSVHIVLWIWWMLLSINILVFLNWSSLRDQPCLVPDQNNMSSIGVSKEIYNFSSIHMISWDYHWLLELVSFSSGLALKMSFPKCLIIFLADLINGSMHFLHSSYF